MSRRILKGRSTNKGNSGSGGSPRRPGGTPHTNSREPHHVGPGDPGYYDPSKLSVYENGVLISGPRTHPDIPSHGGSGSGYYVPGSGFGLGSNGLGNGDLGYMHLGAANATLGSGNYLDYLYQLLNGEVGFDMSAETKRMILEQLMQYGFTNDQRRYDQLLTQDQRQYDQKLLNEQRAYDKSLTEDQRRYNEQWRDEQRVYESPTNQLARMMGAGISRDAALQMMSGGAAGSAGMSAGTPVQGSSISEGSPITSGIPSGPGVPGGNSSIQTAQTVIQGIQAVGNLVAQGFDMYSAVQQARAMSMQNYMSKQQLDAFNSVNQVTSYLQDGVTQGFLTPDDLNSWKNANDVYTWLNDHADTNFVKPLMSSGAFRSTFGSTLGRELFNNHWKQMQESKSAGEIYDSFVRQQQAAAKIASFNVEESYFSVQQAIANLSKTDVEIQNLWNDVWNGNLQIEINGQLLEREKFATNQARTRNDIFDAVYNQRYGNGSPDLRNLGSGAAYLAFSQFDELGRMFTKAFALSGTKERRDAWEKFYLENADAAKLMAGIKKQMTEIQSNTMNPDMHPNLAALVSMYQIGQLTGAFDLIGFGTNSALKLTDILTQ